MDAQGVFHQKIQTSRTESASQYAWVNELINALGLDELDRVPSKQEVIHLLAIHIAKLDRLMQTQLDEVLHHPQFQALEASWLGCHFLLNQIGLSYQIKVKMLNVSWSELNRDVMRAIEIDQSEIFNKVYNGEFGIAGGEPFSAMLCNFDVALKPHYHGVDDLRLVDSLAQVAAAAFCPFIFNTHPSLLDLDEFTSMNSLLNLQRTYQQLDFMQWKNLRRKEDARFIGLTLPSIYLRRPYMHRPTRTDQFVYQERLSHRSDRLKTGAVFALGAIMARCFANTGWLAEITGERHFGGGVITNPYAHQSEVDLESIVAAEIMIPDNLERTLTEYGFISACYSANGGAGLFYSVPSIQSPPMYSSEQANINARYSAMLQYVLCTSRFAHYLKVIVRDHVGSFYTAEECRRFLQGWIMNYVMATDEASDELLARYPLRDAQVSVNEKAGVSGTYMCVVHLKPHFQLETIETSIQFSAEVVSNRVTG
ncbi:type VI secretion system contractile sheath large subunit [Marinomonas gallaica]|uniref:type VI secretion system contractile sheath large subunit n=1 Tax=Marinomonas gallaica TaxID=1806667 RepID=UPI003CE5AE40